MAEELDMITFKQIEIFLAVAAHKSFSSAASSLFLHQSSVSRNIKCLEDALGVQLFLRNDKGAILTEAGSILYREFSAQRDRLADVIRLARNGLDYKEQKKITVGYLQNDEVEVFVNRIVQSYRDLHPDVKVILEAYSFTELRDNLIYGFLDCIITFGLGFALLRNIRKSTIRQVDSYFAIPASHPMLLHRETDMRYLSSSALYLVTGAEMQNPEDRALRICRQHGFEPRAVCYEPTRRKVELAVKNGLGFTIDGSDFSKRFPKDIVLFKIKKAIEDQSFIVAWHENHCPEIAQDFIDFTLSEGGN